MKAKTKIALINQMIDDYYEFLFTTDDAKNAATMETILSAISAIGRYDEPGEVAEEEKCCGGHCGECHNSIE